jgi:hypothetical protein
LFGIIWFESSKTNTNSKHELNQINVCFCIESVAEK